MKLADIISLARAGYKLDEIKEMEKQEEEEEENKTPPEDNHDDPEDKDKDKDKEDNHDEQKDKEKDKETTPNEDKNIDELKKQIEELNAKLLKAQQDNRSEDMSGKKESDEDILTTAIRGFM